jgi:hypothetical protein
MGEVCLLLPCDQLHIEGIVSGISLATVKLCKKPMQREPRYLRLSRDEADAAAGSVCVPVVLTADREEGSLFRPGKKKAHVSYAAYGWACIYILLIVWRIIGA